MQRAAPVLADLERMLGLEGRVALVTGASRGIGRAVARLLAALGADVAIDHQGDAAEAEALAGELRAAGRRAAAFDVDVARPDIVDALVRPAEAALGPIDLLVISAARSPQALLEELEETAIRGQIETNFMATVRLIDAVVPGMAARGFGRVVAIGSIVQTAPLPSLPIYGALKAAQEHLMRHLAVRFARSGVTFNTVSPGLVRTERNAWRRRPGGDWERFAATANFMGRAGEPEEIAFVVAMLCAPGASYVTGENLYVAGGGQIAGRREAGPLGAVASGSTP